MASIVEQVTAAKLSQEAAAAAAEAAVHATGLGTAGIVRVGENLIVTSRRGGDNQFVLIVNQAGEVSKGFAKIEFDALGRTIVTNVEHAQR